jgi:two-component system sensor histidine kinase MprB
MPGPGRRWLRGRSLSTRISALVAAAVGIAVTLAAAGSYIAVDHQLHDQATTNLAAYFGQVTSSGGLDQAAALRLAESSGVTVQLIFETGGPEGQQNAQLEFTPTRAERAVVNGPVGDRLYSSVSAEGQDYRVLTGHAQAFNPATGHFTNAALQLYYPLGTIEHTLATLRLILLIVALAGIAVAVALGLAVAQATIRPVKRLTAAAEHVAATQDLDATIDDNSEDELGRLATAFNAMLGALGASRQQQAQLVSDAGHELRTPLTSLRTNIEFLMKARNMPEQDREDLLTDVQGQLEELTTLIGDIVETARQDEKQPEPVEVRLDAIVGHAIERARRRAPSLPFDVALTPGSVRAQPAMLERAVLNVLDNAAKWSPPGGTIEVRLDRGERWLLEIRDHGPGIAPDDLPKVLDRFYRAPTARSMPGSGLGLAIVDQVVRSHGGSVTLSIPPDGGTLVRIELPTVAEQEPAAPDSPTLGDPAAGPAPPGPAAPAAGVTAPGTPAPTRSMPSPPVPNSWADVQPVSPPAAAEADPVAPGSAQPVPPRADRPVPARAPH